MINKIIMPEFVQTVLSRLSALGYKAYLVGGCVRDSLLGVKPADFDVATNASVVELKKIFSDYKTVNKNGERHGTVTIVDTLNTENSVEISTYKTTVKENGILSDLKHRDFTINAIAYNNYYIQNDGSIEDLKNKIIRCVGNPYDRFNEDYLRILRALRFASVLGFTIEENTKKAIFKMKNNLKSISAERIQKEFNKIITGKNCYKVLKEFREVIAVFIPKIQVMFEYNQMSPYHPNDLYEHTLQVTSHVTPDLVTRLSAFFHDIGKPQARTDETLDDGTVIGHYRGHAVFSQTVTKNILKRLKYPTNITKQILFLVFYHDFIFTEEKKNTRKFLKKLDEALPKENKILMVDKLLDIRYSDRLDHNFSASAKPLVRLSTIRKNAQEILAQNEALKITDLKINGYDLMKLGYQGVQIGECLNELLECVLDNELVNEKKTLLKFLKKKRKRR